ncbi:MAG: hypothetical protein SFW63_08230 [Alphaproteobacteria bacterium]|nr:hypothetical protein [Alphaproteobacteria bacterium]
MTAAAPVSHKERLTRLVMTLIERLERAIESGDELQDQEHLRLFGAKKSYADVLVDLCEVMLKLEAAQPSAHGRAMMAAATSLRVNDQDVSLIKYYIQRQKQLAQTALAPALPQADSAESH